MAYSDYGGYAFRNGVRVEDRSDCDLTANGLKSTPGQWPDDGADHVLLGSGPFYVGLYKQMTASLYEATTISGVMAIIDHPLGPDLRNPHPAFLEGEHLNEREFLKEGLIAEIERDGHLLKLKWVETDNIYVLAELTEPDGTIWTGFSGYGVGAGLEGSSHGCSTGAVQELMWSVFPAGRHMTTRTPDPKPPEPAETPEPDPTQKALSELDFSEGALSQVSVTLRARDFDASSLGMGIEMLAEAMHAHGRALRVLLEDQGPVEITMDPSSYSDAIRAVNLDALDKALSRTPVDSGELRTRLLSAIGEHHSGDREEGERILGAVMDALQGKGGSDGE